MLFTAQGINATGMEQLSIVAEVSKRTLYAHFPSKDELVRAYLQSLVDELLPVARSPTGHCAHQLAAAYKREFTRRLTDVARQAGVADPECLGEQLALLSDGAAARGTALNGSHTGACARSIAELLVDAAHAEAGPASP
ncbi:helix-turn-helix domain-containing protein [Streptomyces sp. NPDC097610]|uniref:TetR/AcrR family transcriptional regulator n=1 Tax=Streptomyces sp. NPDC097610 TaxID=3157227 RepID=UPI0033298BCA